MKIYHLKTCDTCRKAIKALPAARFVDVRTEGVPAAVMAAAQAQFGEALLNTRSTTWRGLDEAERARPADVLMVDHPTLMKRPLIVEGEAMYLGWTKDVKGGLGVD